MTTATGGASPSVVREFVIDWLRKELVGPSPGYPMTQLNGEEILRPQDPPRYRYGCGILFPKGATYSGGDSIDKEETAGIESAATVDEGGDAKTEDVDDSEPAKVQEGATVVEEPEVAATGQFLPQTMGVSFLVRVGAGLRVRISWGAYRRQTLPWKSLWQAENPRIRTPEQDPGFWFRTQFVKDEEYGTAELLAGRRLRRRVLTGQESPGTLEVDVVSRPWNESDQRLITITLINTSPTKDALNERCFFQCSFEVEGAEGARFEPYPERSSNEGDEDSASLALLYRHRPTYAVGHGCAAEWQADGDGRTILVRTETLPVHRQTPVAAADEKDIPNLDLRMSSLGEDKAADVTSACEALASEYERWIARQESALANDASLTPDMIETGRAHLGKCRTCLARIRDGIALLAGDRDVFDAFQSMNLAMLEQREHYGLSSDSKKRRKWREGVNGPEPERPYVRPTYGTTRWRPFQLAFVLMNLRPMYDPECAERDIVDVIWFPTGGGKTEAYLGLAAFGILLRRLLDPKNAGTTVLMRYTLRLLTTQQFQRAASLICALELRRRRRPKELGTAPISIGLWVGGGVTPNRHSKAVESFNKLCDGAKDNPFILLSCPWCGVEMGSSEDDVRTRPFGYEEVRDDQGEKRVRFRCEDPGCDFSGQPGLPVEVVDEAIYGAPPTLLIGTVDKFALLPFEPEARRLFGIDTAWSPPDLIIQDELHLISGPLGSMVGHYETIIDELCTTRPDGKVIRPRIVASTATIARASEQVLGVYGRFASLFPPQGLRAGESFFAREGDSARGRAYVGVHAVALSSHVTAQVRTLAALLQAPGLVEGADDASKDPYWTLVTYFNSLRELGRAATLVNADVREYLNAVWERIGLTEELGGQAAKDKRRFINRFTELTSRMRSVEIPEKLQELFTPNSSRDAVDLCFATNMIQVGLDVPRLSLMMIVGQPKGASEYIQASSRVGREWDKPGLVVANYNPFKPRDRSHFETFRSYHENAYRYVEPTSVTPFSLPVCERAIHALAITLVRYRYVALRRSPENGVSKEIIKEVTEVIRRRVAMVSPDDESRAMRVLARFFDVWNRSPPNHYGGFNVPQTVVPMMWPAGKELPLNLQMTIGVNQTPSSMRNVDADCEAMAIQQYNDGAAR